MGNYILSNRDRLKTSNYLLLANQAGHWFNASPNVMSDCVAKFDNDFCLVLYRSGPSDDAYVMPFRRIKSLFIEDNLTAGTNINGRWHGSIRDGHLNIRGALETIAVSQHHNALDLLK